MTVWTRGASRLAVGLALALTLAGTASAQGRGGRGQAPEPEPLRWRFMGPSIGNRIAAVAGVPGDPSIYYAGAASGGVWKSSDGGATFAPIFDGQPVAAIGALAVAPSDRNTVWAGTGEAWVIRPSDVIGDGIYKSTDAGATWTRMGLDETGRIGRILVHPTDPNIVYACALGRVTGAQPERGVFKTTDGGRTWTRSLFVDPNTGCSGLSMDAKNPNVLMAGTWQVEMHPWVMLSGGPGSGLYKSTDAGATWAKVANAGLPKSPLGKIDVAIAPSSSARVYALIQTADQGSLWRSDDAGTSWKVVSWDRALIGRAGYYIRLGVSPANADEVLVANSSSHRSTDGGVTFQPWGGCGDCHDIWFDPTNADRFAMTDDGGMQITTNHGQAMARVRLPIGQMYHVAVDNQVPYYIYSNMQDNGTMRGPSTSPEAVVNNAARAGGPATGRGGGGGGGRGGAAVPWDHALGGCESGFTIPDPANPDVVWSSCYGNKLTRYDARQGTARSVSPGMISLDSPPTDTKYRCHWTAPLAIDPFDSKTVYYGCQVIFATSNGGQSWKEISPDLSTRDPSRIVPSGGIVGDNLGQFYGEVVFAIAPSPLQRGLIWAGTNDGKVWNTRDAGANWTDVTKNLPGLPAWSVISKIDPSNFEAGTAYVAADGHLTDGRAPLLYKTTDFGATWKNVSGDLPAKHPLDYTLSIAENPNRRGMLFVGTGHGFYYTLDDGVKWTQLQTGLPAAPVTWVVVQKQAHDVVLSTYGRGLYILDDITPLEQPAPAVTAAARLFAPRPAYRLARSGRAQFTYSMPTAAPLKMEIADASGTVVRTVEVPGRAGLNRLSWDLRYEAPRLVALRTTPPENPNIWSEPRFAGQDTRPITHWGLSQAQVGPLAAPGKYTLKVTTGGQTLSQPFEVLKDPQIVSSDADLVASTEMQKRIVKDLNETSDMVNHLETVRRQIEDKLKASQAGAASLRETDAQLASTEYKLIEKASTLSDDKYFVQAYKVYSNLIWLNGAVGTGAGDEAGGADYRPTDTQVAVLESIEKDLAVARAEYQALLKSGLLKP
ncbi:MAG: sialidase [Vicinamibacterales bacterium]